MKEITLKVGELFEFAAERAGKELKEVYKTVEESGDSGFIKIPFTVQIKNEADEWVESSDMYCKTDAIWEIEFEKDGKKKVGKYAARHIFAFDIENDKNIYAKDLVAGDTLPGGFVVKSSKKVEDKNFVYSPSVVSEKHLYQDADGLLHHNTHTAKAIIQKYYPTCTYGQPAVNEGEYSYSSGDIGTAISDIVVFLYRHRLDNLIVLDDCDAFISKKAGKPAVANLLKAALNSNPEKGADGKWGNVVSVGPEIAKNANRKLGTLEEGKVIEIDLDVLNEEKCLDVYINGDLFASTGRLNENEIKKLKKDLPFLNKKKFNEDIDFDEEDEGEILGGDKQFDGETGIGTEFVFTAPVLLISNLKEDEVDDAVVTRCEVYELDIKPEEFLIRSAQIIDNLEIGSFSTFDPEEIAFAKKQVMGGLKLAIDSMNKGIPLDPTSGRPVTIKKTLQFRVFSDLAGSYLAKMDDWIDDNDVEGLEDAQRILEEAKKTASGRLLQKMNTLNSFNEIVGFFIQGDWIKWDLIPYLEMRRI